MDVNLPQVTDASVQVKHSPMGVGVHLNKPNSGSPIQIQIGKLKLGR